MPKLELDDVDIDILSFLADQPNSTTSDIAKAIWWKKPFNLRKVDCFIRYRLKRFIEEGIVHQTRKHQKNIYTIDDKQVFFGNGVLEMNGLGKIDMGYFIVIKKKDETVAKSIDDHERRLGVGKIISEQA